MASLAFLRALLARAWTPATAPSPTTPATNATTAAATAVRLRRAHRRARREKGSRQAETGSSAIHRSMSSARARHEAYRSSGFKAMALRQTASSARSIAGSIVRGGRKSPRCTPRRMAPMSSPSKGGRPVSKQ